MGKGHQKRTVREHVQLSHDQFVNCCEATYNMVLLIVCIIDPCNYTGDYCLGDWCPGDYYTGSTCVGGYCRCVDNPNRDYCTCLCKCTASCIYTIKIDTNAWASDINACLHHSVLGKHPLQGKQASISKGLCIAVSIHNSHCMHNNYGWVWYGHFPNTTQLTFELV